MQVKYHNLLILMPFLLISISNCSETIQSIIEKSISLRSDGKINIPDNIKHIRLDIGLSYSAPMSQYWLSHEKNDLLVFGFEPNPACVQSILKGAKKWHPAHGEPLETNFIGKQFFLIPCALGLSISKSIPFFVTKDCGCSSLYQPKFFEIERIITVPIFSLKDFFDLFPFDTHPVIDYIKIDAQGADLDIVKSADHHMAERVVYITIEPEDSQYHNTSNSLTHIDFHMQSIGFTRHTSPYTADPTYLNTRFIGYAQKENIKIYQNG